MHQGPHPGGFGQGNSRATARLGPTSAEWNDARLRARKAAPATHRAATWHLRKLTDYLGATAPIASITPNDLALLVECLAADGLQTRSINQILGTARQFFSWATATDLIPRNPMAPIHNTRAPRRAVRAVPPHHVTLILDHADLRTQVIIVLLAQIGFRRGALAGIRWEDYDPGTGRLLIRQDKGARDHTVVLAREPKEALEKWRAHQAAYRTPAMGPPPRPRQPTPDGPGPSPPPHPPPTPTGSAPGPATPNHRHHRPRSPPGPAFPPPAPTIPAPHDPAHPGPPRTRQRSAPPPPPSSTSTRPPEQPRPASQRVEDVRRPPPPTTTKVVGDRAHTRGYGTPNPTR